MDGINRKKPKIDVAIVDMINIGYGGNLGGYLRKYDQYQSTRIIYYSALTEKQFNNNILETPGTYYVQKVPGSIKTVIEIIKIHH